MTLPPWKPFYLMSETEDKTTRIHTKRKLPRLARETAAFSSWQKKYHSEVKRAHTTVPN